MNSMLIFHISGLAGVSESQNFRDGTYDLPDAEWPKDHIPCANFGLLLVVVWDVVRRD